MRYRAALLVILAGCNTVQEQPERFVPARPVTSIVSDTVVGTAQGAWGVVQTPFEDLNLKRQAIPPKLQQISSDPYALPPQLLCEGIRKELEELDGLLGPDICTAADPTGSKSSRKGEYIEQGAGFASDQAIGLVRGRIEIMPFRGVVRKMTGAEKHAKAVEKAYQAGRLRRAFLKGLAASLGKDCLNPPPAETGAKK